MAGEIGMAECLHRSYRARSPVRAAVLTARPPDSVGDHRIGECAPTLQRVVHSQRIGTVADGYDVSVDQ
jgi:hypothetical protein